MICHEQVTSRRGNAGFSNWSVKGEDFLPVKIKNLELTKLNFHVFHLLQFFFNDFRIFSVHGPFAVSDFCRRFGGKRGNFRRGGASNQCSVISVFSAATSYRFNDAKWQYVRTKLFSTFYTVELQNKLTFRSTRWRWALSFVSNAEGENRNIKQTAILFNTATKISRQYCVPQPQREQFLTEVQVWSFWQVLTRPVLTSELYKAAPLSWIFKKKLQISFFSFTPNHLWLLVSLASWSVACSVCN